MKFDCPRAIQVLSTTSRSSVVSRPPRTFAHYARLATVLITVLPGSSQWIAAQTAFDQSMMKPDDSDRFSLDSTFPGSGFTGYNINLTSQTWRGPSEITPSWKDPSDVTQDYMLNEQDVTIDHFFVLGASKLGDSKLGDSKRGWTTWLTAAAEARLGGPNRVSGIAPAVIDFLDLDESMAHYRRAYEGVTDHITGRHVASVAILTTDATALVVQPKYLVGDIGGIPIKFATDVSVAQVPEPATFALLLLSCMVGLFGAFQAIGGKS